MAPRIRERNCWGISVPFCVTDAAFCLSYCSLPSSGDVGYTGIEVSAAGERTYICMKLLQATVVAKPKDFLLPLEDAWQGV